MKLPCKATAGSSPGQPLPLRGLSAPSRKSKEEKQRTLPSRRALGVCQTPQLTFGHRPFQLLEFCHRFIFMGRLLFFLFFFKSFHLKKSVFTLQNRTACLLQESKRYVIALMGG